MFYPVGMQKIRLYALKSISEDLIRELHELGMVEIVASEHKENGLECGSPSESFNRISVQLVRMRAIKNNLTTKASTTPDFSNPLAEAEKITIDEEMKKLYEELSRIDSELKKISEDLNITKRLQVFKSIDFTKLNTRTISYLAGVVPRENLRKVTKELESVRHKLHWVADKKEVFLVIVFEKGHVDVERLISSVGFRKLEVPSELTSPEKYIFWLEREAKIKQKRIEEIKSKISSLSDSYYGKVSTLENQLSILADRAEVAARFCSSRSTYIIDGWIKEDEIHKLETALKKYDGRVYVTKLKTGHHDVAPTILNHEGAANPYKFMTKNYSLPNANEIDPTILYFVTIPILYGMILADVVYGFFSIFIAYFFLKKFKNSEMMSSISKIWLFSAIPAIIFGFMFDEYAGMTHYHFLEMFVPWGLNLASLGITGPIYHGLSRLHYLTTIFQITLYVGMIHLGLGFLLGAINDWGHNKRHAIGKIAWIGVEIGGYLAIASFLFSAYPADIGNIGAAILGISIATVAFAEGIVGILEVPGLAGNVFSYLRIAVVGVVGTILAEIINSVFTPTPEQGLIALLFFPLFLGLHILNAFIAMFEAMIQGGRLNIIEFKMKFLKGGGRLFKPFAIGKIL